MRMLPSWDMQRHTPIHSNRISIRSDGFPCTSRSLARSSHVLSCFVAWPLHCLCLSLCSTLISLWLTTPVFPFPFPHLVFVPRFERDAIRVRTRTSLGFEHAFHSVERRSCCLSTMARGMDASSSRITRRTSHLAMAGAFFCPLPTERASALGFRKELKPRRTSIPPDAYVEVGDTSGLLAAEVRTGDPKRTASLGDRVAVHYDVKWKNLTIGSSRVGAGVTGGTPYGYDVGRFGGCASQATDVLRSERRRRWEADGWNTSADSTDARRTCFARVVHHQRHALVWNGRVTDPVDRSSKHWTKELWAWEWEDNAG